MNDYVTDEFLETLDPSVFEEGVTMKGEDLYTITEGISGCKLLILL